jgi:hypothetical protein
MVCGLALGYLLSVLIDAVVYVGHHDVAVKAELPQQQERYPSRTQNNEKVDDN